VKTQANRLIHKKSNGPGNTARVSNRIAIGMSLLCSSVRANTIHPEIMNKQMATNMVNAKGDTCFPFLMMGILFFLANRRGPANNKSTSTKGLDNLEKEYYTRAMIIGVSQITLHLPDSQSLKDKRQIIKSILARVRNRFEVAIAEVEDQDRWQIAVLGLSCVSNSKQHSEEILERVRRYIEETRPDIVVSNVETEMITW